MNKFTAIWILDYCRSLLAYHITISISLFARNICGLFTNFVNDLIYRNLSLGCALCFDINFVVNRGRTTKTSPEEAPGSTGTKPIKVQGDLN